jgi:hypothetical protein
MLFEYVLSMAILNSFNPDACEQCRDTPVIKTRVGSTLITSFTPPKQLMVATAKPQGPTSRQGPSAGPPGDAGRAGAD